MDIGHLWQDLGTPRNLIYATENWYLLYVWPNDSIHPSPVTSVVSYGLDHKEWIQFNIADKFVIDFTRYTARSH